MNVVVFDGQCLLCSRWVRFLLKHDRQQLFRYASIQGATGQRLLAQAGLRIEGLQTMLLLDEHGTWQHTSAILRVLDKLGWPWKLAWATAVIPAGLRDKLYRLVARNRYRWFGKSEACLVPSAATSHLFLD